MAYFSDSYDSFKYPIKLSDTAVGFRNAQLGAIHALAGHFSNRSEPAIVTMPTGSGKTAVLIAAAFVLRAKRVLVLTPSRLVREQIAEEVANLTTLREAGALPAAYRGPKVMSTIHRVTTPEQWEEMRGFDVVVATVQSISPEYEGTPEPPNDLFDLVLVDEAHHSPARTWRSILEHFESARQVLFTATPFRQDQKEIRGRFVFTYDLRAAFDDGIFGTIVFKPVTPSGTASHDTALAIMTNEQFSADRKAGFDHRVMVRTDGLPRAKELLEIYERETSLKLRIILGTTALRTVKKIIEELRVGTLDGIVCVNMLGEGFNFPSLKIAAIHSPHKSLSVTLQFVGRFARTSGLNLGPATFLAVPSDIEIEAERLYDTRAVWQDIIQNLGAIRIDKEVRVREVLESFSQVGSVPDLSDLSLHSLEPYYHVKVFQLEDNIDIGEEIRFPDPLRVVYRSVSTPESTALYITREISQPRWTTDDRLSNVESDLFIFYFDEATKLFFVCASRRNEGMYADIAKSFAAAAPRPLPLVRLNRALNDLKATEFFNVGMRNRVKSNTTESYRIIAGSNADKSILKSDSRLYHRGHVFGRASDNGDAVTIGLSSASKVWSNRSSHLPELIGWCQKLATRISSDRIPITNSGLDFLDTGEEIEALPPGIIAVDWPKNVYTSSIMAKYVNDSETEVKFPIIEFALTINPALSTPDAVMVELQHDSVITRCTFSFDTDRFFEPASDSEPVVEVERDRSNISLIDFLNHEMPLFYTSDLSLIDGSSLFRVPLDDQPILDTDILEEIDWAAHAVDINCEFGTAAASKVSIHEYLGRSLASSGQSVVYYDHGTGEIADYVSFEQRGARLNVSFYHCKKSSGAQAGHRLDDMSELTAQVVKSVTWVSKQRILDTVRRRYNHRKGAHTFIVGDLASFERLLIPATPASIDFQFVAVQPGLLKAGLPQTLSNMLAAASDYLVRAGFQPLRILGS